MPGLHSCEGLIDDLSHLHGRAEGLDKLGAHYINLSLESPQRLIFHENPSLAIEHMHCVKEPTFGLDVIKELLWVLDARLSVFPFPGFLAESRCVARLAVGVSQRAPVVGRAFLARRREVTITTQVIQRRLAARWLPARWLVA